MDRGLGRSSLFAYTAFALPLALAALAVYVHLPKFYGDTLGMPLATVGAILLASIGARVSPQPAAAAGRLHALAEALRGIRLPPVNRRRLLRAWQGA